MVQKENPDFEYSVILSSLLAKEVSNLMRMMEGREEDEVKKFSHSLNDRREIAEDGLNKE